MAFTTNPGDPHRANPYGSCQSFEFIPRDASCSSSFIGCRSRDISVSSRMSAISSTSSLPQVPPWETNESLLHNESDVANHYDYDLPCEFEFLGCNIRFHPQYYESWISHTASHFIGTIPPPCTVCPFCDGEGSQFKDYNDPISNWRKRMIHIGGHLAQGSCNGTQPDFWIVEYMLKNDIINKDDYAGAMPQASKPKFDSMIHKGEVRSLARIREEIPDLIYDLDKERRQMRKEKQKGKGRPEDRSRRSKERSFFITDAYGLVTLAPGSTSANDSDQRPDDSIFHEIGAVEVPSMDGQDNLTIINPEMTKSRANSTLDLSSSSDDTDSDEEIDWKEVVSPWTAAVTNTP